MWSTILLILKNWKYVVQFATLLDKRIEEGMNEHELNKGMEKINEAFTKPNVTNQQSADNARSLNDSFRL